MQLLHLKDFGTSNAAGLKQHKVWWMNIGCEKFWNNEAMLLPHMINNHEQDTIRGIEQLCLLVAGRDDLVIQQEMPPKIICDNLKKAGISIPKVISCGDISNGTITQAILTNKYIANYITNLKKDADIIFMPYGITEEEEKMETAIGGRLYGANSKITAWVNSKISAREVAQQAGLPVTEGKVCHNVEEIDEAYNRLLQEQDTQKVVIKQPYGASGKGLFIVNNKQEFNFFLRSLKRKKADNFELIIEKWYDTLFDVNYQIFIRDDGKAYYIPPKNQIVSKTVYIGCNGVGQNDQLTNEQKLYFEHAAEKIARVLYEKGYWGMASIDAIIKKNGSIVPVIEINGRFSLSTYISFISELIDTDRKICSRYYNILSNTNVEQIFEKLNHILYDKEKENGIIIYSYNEGKNNNTNGRVFILFIGNENETTKLFNEVQTSLSNLLADGRIMIK